jgi:hypothetical protein
MTQMRKETVLAPDDFGRDAGKHFLITELPALRAEKWAWRMFLALKGTAGHIPTDIEESIARLGMVGVAIRGVNAFLAAAVRYEEIEPLLDEMLTCVQRVRDPRHPEVAQPLIDGDVLEIKTLMWLRGEVLRIHVGFTAAEVMSRLTSALARNNAISSTT